MRCFSGGTLYLAMTSISREDGELRSGSGERGGGWQETIPITTGDGQRKRESGPKELPTPPALPSESFPDQPNQGGEGGTEGKGSPKGVSPLGNVQLLENAP